MKELTPISKNLHFKYLKSIRSWRIFHALLINAHYFIYNQIDSFAFFFETYIEATILV